MHPGARGNVPVAGPLMITAKSVHPVAVTQVAMTPLHSPALAAQRYAAYASEIQPGARLYNVFWQPFENSGVLPSDVPLTCPPGYSQVGDITVAC